MKDVEKSEKKKNSFKAINFNRNIKYAGFDTQVL